MSKEAKARIKINKLLDIGKNMKELFPKLMKSEVSMKGMGE